MALGPSARRLHRQEEVKDLTTRRARILAVFTAVTLVLSSAPAFAAPTIGEKRDQARAVKADIDKLDIKVEIAAEQYNEAEMRYRKVTADVQATERRLGEIKAEMADLQSSLNARANGMYRSGPFSFLEVLLGTTDFEAFSATWDLLTDINRKDAEVVGQLKTARAEAKKAEATLREQQAAAEKERDEMASRKRSIERRLAERERMLAGIEGEIAAIERAERERAEEAARRALASRRRSYASRGDAHRGGDPKRAARGEVVDIAMRYLGTPYRWGASGPNAFDCSGFTMFVYAQVGVSLPHSSRAQIGYGERVSRANLQPGDLVFFGSPIHHVGIYVGGGSYIHAPRTGDVVKISPLSRSDYAGACRP